MNEAIITELRKWAKGNDPWVRADVLAELVGASRLQVLAACGVLTEEGLIDSARIQKPGDRRSAVHYRAIELPCPACGLPRHGRPHDDSCRAAMREERRQRALTAMRIGTGRAITGR